VETIMPEASPARDPLEQLAEEWRERLRRGERFEADEYIERHPELADGIRDLFPAVVLMEDLKPGVVDVTGAYGPEARPAEAIGGLQRLGDFRILREVGRGGMGVVYEAEQESLGRRVALKVLPAQALADRHQQMRFQREARATARLHHTNIVPVYGVGQHDGLHYYVMQFIQGAPLDQVLTELKRLRQGKSAAAAPAATLTSDARRSEAEVVPADVARSLLTGTFQASDLGQTKNRGSGQRPPSDTPRGDSPQAPRLGVSDSSLRLPGQGGSPTLVDSGHHYYLGVARIGIQVAEALDYANSQGIVHRDIKPSNLLLDNQATVWVTDFGLAKALADTENLTHTGDIVGTLRYMAPERFTGQADARGDIYSLGLTLYELLVQHPAFAETDRNRLVHQVTHTEPSPPRQLNPDIPRDLETIVLKAIDHEPARRYQTAAAMALDLKRFVEDKPIGARRVTQAERLWRWCRRNPALASLAATILFLLVVMAIASTVAAVHFQELAGQEQQARHNADAALAAAESARQSEARQLQQAVQARQLAETARKEEAKQRQDAESARKLAEQNFREARQAVEELLTKVSEGRLKHLPGMQPLRKELLESALKYYQGFVAKYGDDPGLKSDLAAAYSRVAGILAEVGSKKEALGIYDKAAQIRTELAAHDPHNQKLKLELVAHHQAVGNLQWRLGDMDAATRSLATAYGVLLALSPQNPDDVTNVPVLGNISLVKMQIHRSDDPEILRAFASVLIDKGAIVQAQDPTESLKNYSQALIIYRNLLQSPAFQGKDKEYEHAVLQQENARLMRRTGNLIGDLGMYTHALFYHNEAKRLLELLIRTMPKHPRLDDFQRDLAEAAENKGAMHAAKAAELERKYGMGAGRFDVQTALLSYQQALVIRQRRAQENPAVPDCQSELAECLFRLALVQAQDNRQGAALASLKQAMERQRSLVATFPEESHYTWALIQQLIHLARLQKAQAQAGQSLQSYRQAGDLLMKLWLLPESAAKTVAMLGSPLDPAAPRGLNAVSLLHADMYAAPSKVFLDLATVQTATDQHELAMASLGQAFLTGTRDADVVLSIPELASLQGRDDFQALVKKMKDGALPWLTDIEAARALAAKENKDLFLYFSGHDWDTPGIAFRKGMLTQAPVVEYLRKHFVPVELDHPLFSPKPMNYPKTKALLDRWKIVNFGTMALADPQVRAYYMTDKGCSEISSWKSADEFLSHLEAHRQMRIARDKLFAQAKKADDALDQAQFLQSALDAVPIYATEDYQDVFNELFDLDKNDQLGLRTKFFHYGLDARRAAISQLLDKRQWQKAKQQLTALLDEPLLTGTARREVYLDAGFAHVGLGQFDRAAADLARGQAVYCGNPEYALLQVFALVQLGDRAGYRQACADLLRLYEDTPNGWHAFLVAWTCAMAPDALDDWSRAIALPSRFVAAEPGSGISWLQWNALGLLHYRAGNLAEAEKAFRKSIAINATWPARNELMLALIFQRLGKDQEARQWLDKSLASVHVFDLNNLHRSAFGAGYRDLLVYQQFVAEALVLFKDSALAKYPLIKALETRAFLHLGQWDKALTGLSKALEKEPENAWLYLQRARCHEKLKQLTEAGADLTRALKLTTLSLEKARAKFDKSAKKRLDRDALEDAYRALAHVQQQLGRPDDAVLTLARAAELGADDADRLYGLAHDLALLIPVLGKDSPQRQQAGDLVVETLKKFCDLRPLETDRLTKDAAFRPLYARADLQQLGKEMAQRSKFIVTPGADLRWLNPALDKKPQDDKLRLERARLLARLGKWHEAALDYDLVLKVVRDRPECWLERGRCHALLQQWDQAAADFANALDLLPDDANLFSPASLACREIAAWKPAFRKTVELRPQVAALWLGRARYHLLRSQWSLAVAAFDHVIAQRPMGSDWYEYAAVQVLAGDLDGYRKTCQKMMADEEKHTEASGYCLARSCCLTDSSGAGAGKVVQWAQRWAGNPGVGWHLHLRGAAAYRAKQFAAAVTYLEASNKTQWIHGHFLNWYYLAMAHHQLGHDEQARMWLDRANRYMDELAATFPGEAVDLYEDDWLEAPLLRQEAERTLNTPQGEKKGP
jgi:serine/threonine protein kinase/tetratricopeptide (TPR) repeat protein